MAARSRATSAARSRAARGDAGLREAIDMVVRALPLRSLTERLASVEEAVRRLEREARGVMGGPATAKRATGKRATAKRASPRKARTSSQPSAARSARKKTAARTRGAGGAAGPRRGALAALSTPSPSPTLAGSLVATPEPVPGPGGAMHPDPLTAELIGGAGGEIAEEPSAAEEPPDTFGDLV
jgi:hypothetical protein